MKCFCSLLQRFQTKSRQQIGSYWANTNESVLCFGLIPDKTDLFLTTSETQTSKLSSSHRSSKGISNNSILKVVMDKRGKFSLKTNVNLCIRLRVNVIERFCSNVRCTRGNPRLRVRTKLKILHFMLSLLSAGEWKEDPHLLRKMSIYIQSLLSLLSLSPVF